MSNKSVYGEHLFKNFKVGSMVSWKPINKIKQYGIITKLFVKQIDKNDRFVAYAKIISATGGSLDLMLTHLELESVVKQCHPQQTKNDS